MFYDGLLNALTGMGGQHDKHRAAAYGRAHLGDSQLLAAYETSSVGGKIVDIPALDATREWRGWHAETESRAKLEAIEKRLGLRGKVKNALISARLYGGAALYASDGLGEAQAIQGPIHGLRVLPKACLTASKERDEDLSSPRYGDPLWFDMAVSGGKTLKIHPSRLALFHGLAQPSGAQEDLFWGKSVLGPVMDPLKALDAALHNASALFHKAVVDTIKSPGLSEALKRPEGEAAIRKRLETFKIGMSIHNLAVLDGEESLDRPAVRFDGQDRMMQEFAQAVAAAADIPMTRLFGRSPSGMNASGQSDLRNYYDRIRAMQELEMAPALINFDRLIVREAVGEAPPTPAYGWRPLWQSTQDEVAETALKLSNALSAMVREGVVDAPTARANWDAAMGELGLFGGTQ